MSVSAIINIAKEYLILGLVGVVLSVFLFLIGYFLVYKKLLKGKKQLEIKKIGKYSILFIYIIVVLGATFGIRTAGAEGTNLHLFSSYKEAWNSFSAVEWRNIILNILMFVPLGILLPLMFKKCEKYWVTYLIGFLATLFLEVLQFITKRGIFELDDIFNNTLGCIIGYGIARIILLCLRDKSGKQQNEGLLFATFQIPLCITVIAFSAIFINYSKQELGNLQIRYTYAQDMSNINVSTDMKLKNKSEKAYVYKASVGTKEESLNLANEILKVVNSKVDESQNNAYDETMVYRSSDEKYNIWVNYVGLTTSYTDFNQFEKKGKSGLSLNEIKKIMKPFGVETPTAVDFTDEGKGIYTISVDMLKSGGYYLDGNLRCTITEGNIVSDFDNNIISYNKYKEYEIISEQEAYDKILKGEFRNHSDENLSKITIKDVKLVYEMDSKGFYQPVYRFIIEGNKMDKEILIPALK